MRLSILTTAAVIAASGLLAVSGGAVADTRLDAANSTSLAPGPQRTAFTPAPEMHRALALPTGRTATLARSATRTAAPRPRLRPHAVRARTGWAALDRAITRIPNYSPRIAHWHVVDKGSWGATDLGSGDIYIAPRTPVDKLVSVVEHEYAHALTGYLYGGFSPAQAAADRLFGQSGEYGLEIEADCMARVEGATWTWYTPCLNNHWRVIARQLLRHRRLL